MEEAKIQLKVSSIINAPFQMYCNDFTFIINGEEFSTNKIIADLISPKISKNHRTDPTINIYEINTQQKGDFSQVLNLINFDQYDIPKSELPFFIEIFEILGYDNIEFLNPQQTIEITMDNVFQLIVDHQKQRKFFSEFLLKEIDFISTFFFDLCEKKKSEFYNLDLDIIMSIISNDKLQLKNEDQLLKFANDFYLNDSKYSILFEKVWFINVSPKMMNEFISVFDANDMSVATWNQICERLKEDLKQHKDYKNRYKENEKKNAQSKTIQFNENDPGSGIISYLLKESNGNIENEINVTSSSVLQECYSPKNVVYFDDKNKEFYPEYMENNWICFEFKKHQIIPTKYTIKSYDGGRNGRHPKSWIIEGSNNGQSWVTISEEKDCPHLNNSYTVHTFDIKNQSNQKFRFLRMRSTGPSWNNYYSMAICSFEIYGELI